MKRYFIQILVITALLVTYSCKDAWEDYTEVDESTAAGNCLEVLESLSDYSNFVTALKSTGLADTLSQSLMYTVWAPSNTVFTNVTDDQEELYQLVANHINKGNIKINSLNGIARAKMINDKVMTVTKSNIEGVGYATNDLVTQNGVIQFIDGVLELEQNIWEYIDGYSGTNKHIEYINSLSGDVFDEEVATIVGYTDAGQAIYDTVSGMVWKNMFLENVADLRAEDSTYTVLILDDAGFDSEYEKFKSYFIVTPGVSDEDLLLNKASVQYKVTKDFVFTSTFNSTDIPTQLLSVDSIMVPVDKSLITSSVKCSNGWVHHIQTCDIPLQNKILPIIVEAESVERYFDNFTINGEDAVGSPAGNKRVKPDASGGFDYVLDNWNTSVVCDGLIIHAGEVASTKYKFYWKAVDDFNYSIRYSSSSDTLRQKLGYTFLLEENSGVYDFNSMFTVSDYIEVLDSTYTTAPEVEVGSTSFNTIRDIYVWLQSETRSAVVADYIKLVPDFE